jgi:hypothetical protein
MNYFLTNWKTTALGAGGALTALGSLLTDLASGDTSHMLGYVTAIITAVGVIFAKDGSTGTNTGIAGPKQ